MNFLLMTKYGQTSFTYEHRDQRLYCVNTTNIIYCFGHLANAPNGTAGTSVIMILCHLCWLAFQHANISIQLEAPSQNSLTQMLGQIKSTMPHYQDLSSGTRNLQRNRTTSPPKGLGSKLTLGDIILPPKLSMLTGGIYQKYRNFGGGACGAEYF